MSEVRESALYAGRVRHRRTEPQPHAFEYGLTLFYLDLDELDAVEAELPFFSVDRPNLISFYREDYLGAPDVPLAAAVRARAHESLGRTPRGPIRMLTNPRYLGYCFNPVTFYYCFQVDGVTLDAIVAEITNTPWGERHAYVLDARRTLRFEFDKAFHVSPFMPMELGYRWRFSRPERRLGVQMDLMDEGRRVFDATLALTREPLTAPSLLRSLLRLLPTTAKVMAGIHYEALRVYLKGNPFFVHPNLREETR